MFGLTLRRSAFGAGALAAGLGAAALSAGWRTAHATQPSDRGPNDVVVFAFNDLGMHCMNEDFSELMILPPYNTLRAQVIRRGSGPDIISGSDATVHFSIPSNTHSADKTNFWTFAPQLFGATIPPDTGLTGTGLAGSMAPVPGRIYEATGIPLTPIDDSGRFNPYPLAVVDATLENGSTGRTYTVAPVSSEISCNLCHNTAGISTATDILRAHDTLHGTNLEASKPVFCAGCHADPALGTPGMPGVPNLSSSMHLSHSSRVETLPLENKCYACHPGIRTQCQRDVHLANDVDCMQCHGGMDAVGDPARLPWHDLPRCGDCHTRAGFEFEPPGVLFKDATGHGGVHCAACHGSPHAVAPNVTPTDNQQALLWQGHPGVINTCTVCHTQQPGDPFPHRGDDD